ncbi:MAG: CRTAC1 family protein [Gammaproteobacteria bacterium]|nr:MAG: CRTAC1 family protein [Gammaproteobacteria bacterium]
MATALISLQPVASQAETLFVDATASSNLSFEHFNGMSGELYFPEMMGGGVALFDYDQDGDLDVYLVQGQMLGGKPVSEATFAPRYPLPLTDRLYRNDLEDGQLRFTDVTEDAGLRAEGYGMGVAAADYDNDGDVDLYVTNYGSNQLWRNSGDGRFEEVTGQAGVDDARWSVSATWVDYDRDGWLDLYVGNYVDYSFTNPKPCRSSTSARDYCSPLVYEPQVDSLFRNRGDGSFEDVSETSGIRKAYGGALGVVAADFDGDRWPDIYVANDGVANQLWINHGGDRFSDEAVMAGVGVNMDGSPEASMGVDAADFDGDGDEDLFMTHLARETNTLFVNDGKGWFEDRTVAMGLANPSFAFTGFGTAWFDYDNDGWLDLLVANGAVTRIEEQLMAREPYPLRQPNQLFRNRGDGRYREVTAESGPALAVSLVSRGAAFGDLDLDGDSDVIIASNAGPAQLLLNTAGDSSGWVGLRLLTVGGTRDAYGARVVLEGERPLWRRSRADGSYASSNDPRVLIGLGERAADKVSVRVIWPDGSEETFPSLAVGRYHALEQSSDR